MMAAHIVIKMIVVDELYLLFRHAAPVISDLESDGSAFVKTCNHNVNRFLCLKHAHLTHRWTVRQGVQLSGMVPDELEYIPDGYTSPSGHPGTLEKITYQTWESFTYESHEQELTKEAWVHLPYGYSEVREPLFRAAAM